MAIVSSWATAEEFVYAKIGISVRKIDCNLMTVGRRRERTGASSNCTMTWQTLSFSAMEGTPWINDGVMKFLFHAVAQRLHHLRDTHQIIFTMDTCRCHIRKDTLRCCGRLGVWPHLNPPKPS